MVEVRNDCVGCPQGCINCGRKYDYKVLVCDNCNSEEEELYDYEGEQLCAECVLDRIPRIRLEDMIWQKD